MARPKKEGLDYFPLDVYLDDKFKFIEIKYKLEGFAIVVKLLQKIYSSGYYTEWREDEELLFADEIRADLELVKEVVEECFKRGIFLKELHDKYKILTSRGIQKRYLEATKKRSRIKIKKAYDLVSEEKTPVKGEETPINSTESTQSKVKESKVKDSKVKDSKVKDSNNTIPDNIDLDNKAIDLCKYYSKLLPGQDITAHLATLKIFICDYGFEWCKEALQKTVIGTNKFVPNYMEKILKGWINEGKEENVKRDRPGEDNSEDKSQYNFNRPYTGPTHEGDIDY